MRVIYVLGLVAFLVWGCKKREAQEQKKPDFETLMGKGFPAWENVQTREDFANLEFFKTLYENNIPLLEASRAKTTIPHIPKVVHFIWIGPKLFPRESVANVRSWIAKHPDWKFKFWTDRDRVLPHPGMQKCFVKDLQFLKLYNCYKKSDNYGEMSDLLRYEILYQEGGVYVDHDVKCIQSFDPLNKAYDLFVGMEMPCKTSLSSSVYPTNNIVGARAGHPVLKRCLDWLADNWDRIEKEYPGRDKDSVINRVSHRTFVVLGDSMKLFANKEGNRDIALPTFYFNAPEEKLAIFSRHLYQGTWFENESLFEKTVRERLIKISKKTNKVLLLFGLMTGVNIASFAFLFFKYVKGQKKRAS